MHDFAGEFETHITVQTCGSELDRLRLWASSRELKFLHIVLQRGVQVSQPMLSRRSHGKLADQLKAAEELAGALECEDFTVLRIKIEAGPTNADIPQSDDPCRNSACYFEHHVKLLLPADAELADLIRLAERHGAHLSKNALAVRSDGCEERFVTQRCFQVGRSTATRRLASLLEEIELRGDCVLDIEEEYVVYDSNVQVDAGWITA